MCSGISQSEQGAHRMSLQSKTGRLRVGCRVLARPSPHGPAPPQVELHALRGFGYITYESAHPPGSLYDVPSAE